MSRISTREDWAGRGQNRFNLLPGPRRLAVNRAKNTRIKDRREEPPPTSYISHFLQVGLAMEQDIYRREASTKRFF